MSLLRQGKAQVLTIYLGESDQWQGTPLYVAIVQFLREQGCAGATVTRAVVGFGAGTRLHESGGWQLASDAPVVIQVVDQPDRLRRLLPHLQEMLSGGLMMLHEIEVLKYSHARQRGLSSKLLVGQVMETAISTASLDTPVPVVVNLLLAAPFRALPVIDGQQRLQGIISTGDLINAGFLPMRRGLVQTALELDDLTAEAIESPLEHARQSTRTAQDIMNRQVRSVTPDISIRETAQIMLETGLRRLPVTTTDGKLVGMVTRTDLLQATLSSPLMSPQANSVTQPLQRTAPLTDRPPQLQPVSNYLNRDVVTVREQAPIAEVIDALITSPLLSRLQEEARPGLLSTLTSWARGKPGRLPSSTLQTSPGKARVAADLMNRDVVTVSEMTSVQKTIERMMTMGRKVVPVVDVQGRLVGVVGRSDLLRMFLEE
ncbi:MAG: CBS domain-containing protein [Chloroflexi bacterium]|nr:MAG: CBS domain-containing protein [Chloroflexota bacterium]